MPKPTLKIGLVLDTSLDPNDGVQQYVVTLGEWLRGQGHDVHYLVGETKSRQLPNIHSLSKNISVRFNGNRTTIPLPTSRRKLRQFLAAERFDVLHVQIPHSPFLAQRLVLSADKKTAIIGTFHILTYNKVVSVGNWLLGLLLRPSLKRFDQIVAVSPAAKAFAKDTFKVDCDVLPNVFDFKRFHSAKPLPQYNDKKPTILFLGRLVPRKGCQVLLEAVNQIKQSTSIADYRILICGDGPMKDSLKKYANDHGLASIVEFTGYVDEADKPRYYASAALSVFPSSAGESFGIVLLEAMACGRSVVLAGDNPGYRSVIQRSEQLFSPKDTAALAEKIIQYLSSKSLSGTATNWQVSHSRKFDTAVVGRYLTNIYYKQVAKKA
jgi:phosphatidylinositol alpha-mannosyltransferase